MSTLGVNAVVSRHASGLHLQPDIREQHWFALVNSRNTAEVENFLRLVETDFDINCEDEKRRTGLRYAVINEDAAMVDLLLTYPKIHLGSILLYVVVTGNEAIAESVITVLKSRGHVGTELWIKGYESDDFTDDVTPLILAAQRDKYGIMKLLLKAGYTITRPHPATCRCNPCTLKKKEASLTETRARINTYHALASPAYICLTSTDPILMAFTMTSELMDYANLEPEFKFDYTALAQQCSSFAVSLVNKCRTSAEVLEILAKRIPYSTRYKQDKYARLSLATEYNLKEFISHPHCQLVLKSDWLGESQEFSGIFSDFIVTGIRIISLPVVAFMVIFLPQTKRAKSWKWPVNKYISDLASYITFLAALLFQVTLDTYDKYGPPKTMSEFFIVIFVFGMWYKNLKTLWMRGFEKYTASMWNVYDLIMLNLFTATFICWGFASGDVAVTPNQIYLPRKLWYQYDSRLLGETFFAYAILFAFIKLQFFLQLNSMIGPLQLSMTQMVKDSLSFIYVMLIFMAAFAVGLWIIYHHYSGYLRNINGQQIFQLYAFDNLASSMSTLFWGILGYSNAVNANVILPEITVTLGNDTILVYNEHRFTELAGYGMYVLFHCICYLIMLTVLTAVMCNSLSKIQENVDMEWKFCRTKVWMIYFDSGNTLPPPYNLIPSPATVMGFFIWLFDLIRRNKSSKRGIASFSPASCCHYRPAEVVREQESKEYRSLMDRLVHRYFSHV